MKATMGGAVRQICKPPRASNALHTVLLSLPSNTSGHRDWTLTSFISSDASNLLQRQPVLQVVCKARAVMHHSHSTLLAGPQQHGTSRYLRRSSCTTSPRASRGHCYDTCVACAYSSICHDLMPRIGFGARDINRHESPAELSAVRGTPCLPRHSKVS